MKTNQSARNHYSKRLLLDVTIASTTDLNTGIQRVVRNISRHAEAESRRLDFECVPVVCHGEQLTAVGFDGRARWDTRLFQFMARAWNGLHQQVATILNRARVDLGNQYLAFLSRLRKLFVPKTLIRSIANTYRRLTGQTIQFRQNDVLVLLDASWDLPLEQLLDQAKQYDASIVTVVYDLIPLLYPNFHTETLRKTFDHWFQLVAANSDLMIGISDTVKQDVANYLREHRNFQDLPALDYFRLGSDITSSKTSTTKVSLHKQSANQESARNDEPKQDEVNRNTSARDRSSEGQQSATLIKDFYLSVGTIEPRKNHGYLLDAFERLWKRGSNVYLVIVGKIGWMCDDLAQRIQNHPELDQRLYFFDQASDEELKYLYRHAKALIFPSIVEGFGLPIVEAFQYALPVLASDTRIHREVATDQALYFSLSNPTHLCDLVRQIEFGEKKLIDPQKPDTTWEASCREFLQKIRNFLDADPSRQVDQTREAA